MAKIERSALVMHTAEQMFDLICDVKRYPEFLPWCAEAHVDYEDDVKLTAGLSISKGGVKQKFTTHNEKKRPQWMTMELADGPFKKLSGIWTFKVLSEEACKVSLELEFEVAGKVVSMAMTPVFKQATSTMVDAFVKRADELYGG